MSVECNHLLEANTRALDGFSSQLDRLYDRMQTAEAEAGFTRAFALPPREIDRLADAAARAHRARRAP